MFEKLASFVYRNSGRVLLVALVGVGVAGVFGLGVAKRLSPYGDSDPSTQSVQVTNRYQAATGRQIDPGVIALVRLGDVHTASAERQRQPRGGAAALEPRHRLGCELLRHTRSGHAVP